MNSKIVILLSLFAGFSLAEEPLVLVDLESGGKRNPIPLVEGAVFQIEGRTFRVEREDDMEKIRIPSFKTHRMPLRNAIDLLLQNAVVPEGQTLPTVAFFKVPEGSPLTLELRNVSLKKALGIISDIYGLQVIRNDADRIILQPVELSNVFETRIYHMDKDQFDFLVEQNGSFESFLEKFGVLSGKIPVLYDYTPSTGQLILRLPPDAHDQLMQHTINVPSKPSPPPGSKTKDQL